MTVGKHAITRYSLLGDLDSTGHVIRVRQPEGDGRFRLITHGQTASGDARELGDFSRDCQSLGNRDVP